jgi:hypothetical protein
MFFRNSYKNKIGFTRWMYLIKKLIIEYTQKFSQKDT